MSERQCAAFRSLFEADGVALFQQAMGGNLRGCPVRSLAWRFLLGTHAGPRDGWEEMLNAQQGDYDLLCAKHCLDPSAIDVADGDLSVFNPLSTAEESPFHAFFQSGPLRDQIDADLSRLHPGDAFFEQPDVQKAMQRILFIWACAHTDISYRQGMHEVRAEDE